MLERKSPAQQSRNRASKRDSFGRELPKTLTESEKKVNHTDLIVIPAVQIDPLEYPILDRHWGNLRISGVPQ